ncbi:MAG: hypothetical protein CVU63_02540 [Deltaproteobacteria bacterium HGW-Deltaproteobacteria-20]|nr:MAG: hypothetical protein CVU63_02540 [Deltaproteobacteria bacterium HGW-Deltaproteobacteria-20]
MRRGQDHPAPLFGALGWGPDHPKALFKALVRGPDHPETLSMSIFGVPTTLEARVLPGDGWQLPPSTS